MATNVFIKDLNSQYRTNGNNLELYNRNAITSEIMNAILTRMADDNNLGERLFEPKFGTGLEAILFEPIDSITAEKLKNTCYFAVQRFFPNIELLFNDIDVTPYPESECYVVALYWKDKTTSELGTTKFKLYHNDLVVAQ